MKLTPLHTPVIQPHESLWDILDQNVMRLAERSILAITSKIVSMCQGQLIDKTAVSSKQTLIEQEAEFYLDPHLSDYGLCLTIKHGLLIPCAGIDESNANDHYILYPQDIQKTIEEIWNYLRKRDHVESLGVIMTDSTTTPLRLGTTGVALGWCGFEPLYSYIDQPDCFGRLLRVSVANRLDGLAAAAVLIMGEGAEQTPIVRIDDVTCVTFQDRVPSDEERASVRIKLDEDLYAPLLKSVSWMQRESPSPQP